MRTEPPEGTAEPPAEPRLTTLDYHRLRASYARRWSRPDLEAAARVGDPSFPERVRALLPNVDERLPAEITEAELSPLDRKLTALCELYRAGSADQRTCILASVTSTTGQRLLGFGYRMGTLGARQRSVDLVRLGLTAIAVDDLASGDVRDVLCILAVMADAARRAGAEPAALFREVAALAPPALSRVLWDFVRDPDHISSLGAMGFRAVEEPGGVRYRQVMWSSPPKPAQ